MREVGQWIGQFDQVAGLGGNATLSVEPDKPGYCFANFQQDSYSCRINFSYAINGDNFKATSVPPMTIFDRQRQTLVIASDHPDAANYVLSNTYTVEGVFTGNDIAGTWYGDAGTQGGFRLKKSLVDTNPPDEILTWEGFKLRATDLLKNGSPSRFLFRGHGSNKWHLCSTLHRIDRFDLIRFRHEACDHLVRAVNATLPRRYDISNGYDFGALLSLVQHHGFPTPLLDWTWSPYIAAYFAFSSRRAKDPDSSSRIFVFDADAWVGAHQQPANIQDPAPVVSIREFEAYDNPRQISQQSCHTFTNVADVAAWIRYMGGENKKYLKTFDIPNSFRRDAMRDLAFMGVTAAAMFPGLDGLCRGVRERLFLGD